jgi:arylsulfatase
LYAFYGLNRNRLEAFRAGTWKLHFTEPVQLYDLAADLGETRNVAAEQPEIVRKLSLMANEIRSW